MGNSANWYNPNFQPQTDDRFNVSVQRQLPSHIVLDVTYYVQLGRNVPYTLNLNLADPNIAYKNGNATTAKVANPFYNLLPANQMPGTLRSQATVAVSALLTPYPQYSALNQWFTPGAGDHYNSLQISVRRAYSNGLTLMFGFNYNHEVAQGYLQRHRHLRAGPDVDSRADGEGADDGCGHLRTAFRERPSFHEQRESVHRWRPGRLGRERFVHVQHRYSDPPWFGPGLG